MLKRVAYPEAFKKAVVKSLIIHVSLLLIALIGLPSVFLPQEQVPMDVVMVELTRGTSDDAGDGMKAVDHLPENTIEEQKNLMPEAKDTRTSAPQKVEVVKTPPAVDPKTMADPEKKVKKPQPSGVDAATAAALAKIEDQLKQRKITQQVAQAQGTEGYKYGTTDKPVKVDGGNAEYIKYRAMVKTKIQLEWIRPPIASGVKYKLSVNVRIGATGQVISKSLIKKSGDGAIDGSIMRAIDRASPFPVPPPLVKDEALKEGFSIVLQ
jgi:outer membrane biosynthesis protein TonB